MNASNLSPIIASLILFTGYSHGFSDYVVNIYDKNLAESKQTIEDNDVEYLALNSQYNKAGADLKAWGNGYTNCPAEIDPCIISCDLPLDFPIGTYFRNGHGRFVADDGTTVIHPFDGDGLIAAITFDPVKGRLLFRNKFVETKAYIEDKKTRTMSQRGVFGTKRSGGFLGNIFRADFKNVANTNVVFSGKTLYALWDGGRPYMLDPLTLNVLEGGSETDLDGLLNARKGINALSAHPRFDPRLNSWISFCANFDPVLCKSRIHLFELDGTTFRSKKSETSFLTKGPSFIHDFVLTKNYCIFNINKTSLNKFSALKAMFGLTSFSSMITLDHDAEETNIILLPRYLLDEDDESTIDIDIYNDDRIKIVPVSKHFNFHFGNAFENENGTVIFDTVQTDQIDLDIQTPNDTPIWEVEDICDKQFPTRLVRYSINMKENEFSVDSLTITTRAPEFPTFPRQLSTRKSRYIYPLVSHNDFDCSSMGTSPAGAIMKCDAENPSKNEVWAFEPYEYPGEVAFVPKVGKNLYHPCEEDAAYVITYVVNGRDKTTDLVIFDVEGKGSLESGPILRINLPIFLPHGLHGSFEESVTFDFDAFDTLSS